MLDFDEEEFICVMTDNNRNGGNKRPGCGWVVVLVAIILLVLL
jgi:hypothetical protein